MPEYEIVKITDLEGNEIGYTIKDPDSQNLETVNIYDAGDPDLKERVDALNDNARLREVWPNARDPEVLELITDPNWEPIETDSLGNALDPKAMMNRFNEAARIVAERRLAQR